MPIFLLGVIPDDNREPNHFHLMVLVQEVEVEVERSTIHTMTQSHQKVQGLSAQKTNVRMRVFSDSIAIMLRSYTRAIKKQNKRSGSLFRAKTKAECVNCIKGVTPSFYTIGGVPQIDNVMPHRQYPQILFNYIHNNPVKAGLVKCAQNWEFSSAADYYGERGGDLVSKKLAGEYLDI